MASDHRRSKNSIEALLKKEADQFEFHALVKLLENIRNQSLGDGVDPTKEPVRFQARITQEFPSTEIHDVVLPKEKDIPPLLMTNFLGLAGNKGPLPDPYTHFIIGRTTRGDTGIRDFLDIFNHRILSILHRIRKKFWVGVSVERPESSLLGRVLRSLLGLGNTALQERLGVPDRSLTYYAGLLWQKPRSAQGLARFLESFFRTPATVDQFQGKWIPVPAKEQSLLGAQHHKLGDSAFVGERYWDQAAHFQVTLGPMSLNAYVNFLKPGSSFREISNLLSYYAGPEQDFRLNLLVKKEEMPKPRLSCGVALGWTSWLNRTTTTNNKDDGQCVLNTKPLQKLYQRL